MTENLEPFTDDSPYASPRMLHDDELGPARRELLPASMLLRGLLTIAGSGAVFGVLGLVIGLGIGAFLPDYYHAVFNSSSLNTVHVGIGLGATQGLATGLGIGCLVVIVTAWRQRGAER